MAVYKVIQDIEAEDKIVGPLTFKGFIYVIIAGLLAFIDIRIFIGGEPGWVKLLFLFLFLPPMLLFGTLASPLGREQPTEVWLLSRVRFLLKPHKRVWDQAGTKQLVTVTAPKRPSRALTKNISQTEVASRLQMLAKTLDSRGWNTPNEALNVGVMPTRQVEPDEDRLAGASVRTTPEPEVDVRAADDILDEQNNAAAAEMVSKLQQAEDDRRLALADQLSAAQAEAQLQDQVRAKAEQNHELTPTEQELLDQIHQREASEQAHSRVILAGATNTPVTRGNQTVKLELAQSGNDLSVAAISSLANRRPNYPGEVSIPL